MNITDLFEKHSTAYYDANEQKTEVLTKRRFENAIDEITKQLEIQENYNEMLVKEIEELKQGLHGIYNLCDNDNPSHEHIWRVANDLLH